MAMSTCSGLSGLLENGWVVERLTASLQAGKLAENCSVFRRKEKWNRGGHEGAE